MRLIDADLLKENCKITGDFKNNFQCVDLITLGNVIDAQPTAYDPEMVVKEIHAYFCKVIDKSPLDNMPLEVLGYNKNICEIVRRGGVK